MVTLDFETRSELDLKAVGPWVYSTHPSTEVLCLAYSFDDRDEVHLWHKAHPNVGIGQSLHPLDLFARIRDHNILEAHNAFFERCMWSNIMTHRYKWPDVRDDQWRCSLAKSSVHALPRALDGATAALGLAQRKDTVGKRLSLKMCKPRKPTANDPSRWHENRQDLEHLWEYCMQDVRAERALSRALDELSASELRVWQIDQKINLRGVRCDRELVGAALRIIADEQRRLNSELSDITDGKVQSATRRAALAAWLSTVHDVHLPDTQEATIRRTVTRDDVPSQAVRALQICREVNRTSTAKYQAMRQRMSEDDRLRDLLLYHAAHTGRWGGKGVQPHNFPRGNVKDMETACDVVLYGDAELLDVIVGEPLSVLSSTLRGAICASEGHDLVVSDFAAIEARVVFWLAGDEAALDVFRSGGDMYRVMAGTIYDKAPDRISKDERQLGKVAILGLGFGMGADKFLASCHTVNVEIDEDLAVKCVTTYRTKHVKVKRLWTSYEDAAIAAVENPGRVFRSGVAGAPVAWYVKGRFLLCKLPSGRCLRYCDPRILMKTTPWGEERPALHYMAVDSYTKRWILHDTYGGKLAENVTQAVARDLMAGAMVRAEEGGKYRALLTVHDELVSEVPEGEGRPEELDAIMQHTPTWAEGLPIGSETWVGKRYRK